MDEKTFEKEMAALVKRANALMAEAEKELKRAKVAAKKPAKKVPAKKVPAKKRPLPVATKLRVKK